MDIKKRRLELGLTLQEVADKVGVTKATVMRWETGAIENMRRDKVDKLATALNVSPLAIMDLEVDYAFKGINDTDIIVEVPKKSTSALAKVFAYAEKIMQLPEEKQKEIQNYIDYVINKE